MDFQDREPRARISDFRIVEDLRKHNEEGFNDKTKDIYR